MPDASPAAGSPSSSSSSSSKSSSGTFGFLTKRIGGVLPVWVIIVAIAALWYWYYHYGPGAQATQAAQQKKQGGNQVVNVRIVDDGSGRHTGTGPTPGPHVNPGGTKQITIERDMTLAQAADYYHWTPETLADIEEMNSIQGQGELTPSTQLHKGETLIRPIGPEDTNGTTRWRTA